MPRRKNRRFNTHRGTAVFLRRPVVQIAILAVVALIVFLIAAGGGGNNTGVASEISVDQAYQMYQEGAFVLDVRTQEEWNEYHAPNTMLIPLDQLQARISELPKDRQIVVVCRSGNRSREGRDLLLAAGYQAASMAGGLKEWSAKGYPIEGTRP